MKSKKIPKQKSTPTAAPTVSVPVDQPSRWVLVWVLLAVALVFGILPLGSAFEFGQDEGFELMKGLLGLKGFRLYSEIWSDQPPIFTLVLAGAFKLFGAGILTARLAAAGFGLLLSGAYYRLVEKRSGWAVAAAATFFLLSAPLTLLLSVSAMQEVATFATALLSLALMVHEKEKPSDWRWLILSGAVMGLAISIKFTAVLVVPTILLMLTRQHWKVERLVRKPARAMLIWGLGAAGVALLIGFIWSSGSAETAWRAHFGGTRSAGGLDLASRHFSMQLLSDHWEGLVGAVIGAGSLLARKRWDELCIPLTLLATAILVHLVHRPWWDYYYLHFAIPLAWLMGAGLVAMVRAVNGLLATGLFGSHAGRTVGCLVLAASAAMLLTRSGGRLQSTVTDLRERPPAAANTVVAVMRGEETKNPWVYAENPIYAIYAGKLNPPELAVVSAKRLASGQITNGRIVEICRALRLEQLVLSPETTAEPVWQAYLETDFELAASDGNMRLYVVKKRKAE